MARRILVTAALPYANGDIHLGHLLEYIQADIWTRFQRMQGHECYYVCADDAHGTPVMLRAKEEGITPEQLVARMQTEHVRDFSAFHIAFDQYYTTHSAENRELATTIYRRLEDGGHIVRRVISQAYDLQENLFLPDRFVRGTCPRCGSPDQYGDTCETCGATYSPVDLRDAVSVVSGTSPIQKDSEHYFFKLSDFDQYLREWTRSSDLRASTPHVDPEVANKLEEWLQSGLRDWDISRDAPYFGFEIPDAPGKYFYVWLDAPIGYIASFHRFTQNSRAKFDDFWDEKCATQSGTELYHFIGKDITYFHTLFWPAMLHGAGLRCPTSVFVHGFVTVNGRKMSKSRGTFIRASAWAKHLSPEFLRYYYAAKLNKSIEDIDFNAQDFIQRINSDLIGKYINIASRSANFLHKYYRGQLAHDEGLHEFLFSEHSQVQTLIKEIGAAFNDREFSRAIQFAMTLADLINSYWHHKKPWEMQHTQSPEAVRNLQVVCSTAIEGFRLLTVALKPVLPILASKVEEFLRIPPLMWDSACVPLRSGHVIGPYEHLMHRVDAEQVETVISAPTKVKTVVTEEKMVEEPTPSISIDDFSSVDLRIARIDKAEHIPEAKKLLKLTVDLGTEHRQVFAGIKNAYTPEELTGKLVVVVANLAPRKMRFGISEGMVLAAGPGGEEIFLISPDSGAKPGMRVK